MKRGQNVCLDEISYRFENGSCWVKTRSLVQILEKPCVCSRSHSFSQNVCLDEISDVFENGSGHLKHMVSRSNLRKTLCTLWRPCFQSD